MRAVTSLKLRDVRIADTAGFERVIRELTLAHGNIQTTVENIEADLGDFKTLAAQTQ